MKKLIIILYIITGFFAFSMLSVISLSYSDQIQGQSQSYIFGSLIGVFILTTTPLGLVFAYHQYSNKNQEKKHAIQ